MLGFNNVLYAGTRGGAIVAVDINKMSTATWSDAWSDPWSDACSQQSNKHTSTA